MDAKLQPWSQSCGEPEMLLLWECFDITALLLTKDSWWSLDLEDDVICASYLWIRE